ncbi:MAG TPA: hypothetical protein VE963_23260, partial [Reyranella sp.]|nr:hypothetical protein [Reyranella sp.]
MADIIRNARPTSSEYAATVETAAPSKNHDLTRAAVTTLISQAGDTAAPVGAVKLNGNSHLPA